MSTDDATILREAQAAHAAGATDPMWPGGRDLLADNLRWWLADHEEGPCPAPPGECLVVAQARRIIADRRERGL